MYMLDTNAIVMGMKHPDWKIFYKIQDHLGIDLCISSITLAELEYGIRKSKYPDQSRFATYTFLAGIDILEFDPGAAKHFGDIYADLEQRGLRISDRDTLIAAHARSGEHILVTNNTREFSRVRDLAIEDWK